MHAPWGLVVAFWRERMSQIMELVWLSPDNKQEILEFPPSGAGRFPISEVAVWKVASLLSWVDQRVAWVELKIRVRAA
jgi:hypothetical protein